MTDYREWLSFLEMLADETYTAEERVLCAMAWYRARPPCNITEAYQALLRYASCADMPHTGRETGKSANTQLLSYTYDGAYLKDFDFGGDGFLSLIVNMYKAGNHCSVVTVDRTGQELGSAQLDVQILDFSAAGSYLAVLTAEKLSIYNSAMELYYEQSNTSSATNVVMRADGSAILLGGGRGEIMLP